MEEADQFDDRSLSSSDKVNRPDGRIVSSEDTVPKESEIPTEPGAPVAGGDEESLTQIYSGSNEAASSSQSGMPEIPGHELIKRIGSGAMGQVFQARHTVLDREVAIKLPLSGRWAHEKDRERFLREARATAKLRHPNICPVYEVGEVAGRPYISMALIKGQTLAQWARPRSLNARQSAEMVAKLSEAVAFAHDHGVMHRDIKPSNVMVDSETAQPVLMDFGLAKEFTRQGSQLTMEGQVMGTPAYMAPEQAAGETKTVGPCSDVYALGAVLYYLLCGRSPFEGSGGDVIRRVQTDEPPAPRKFAVHTHRDLETICLKAMAKEPVDRYGSAAMLAEDLQRFCAGESILARREGVARRCWRKVRRRPLSAALFLMLLIAVGGFGYVTFRGGRIADLRDGIEEIMQTEDWTPGDLKQAEALIDRLGQWDPQHAAEDSRRLHEQYAAAIRRAIQQPKLFRQEIAKIKTQLTELAVRDPGLAAVVRAELEQRSADWQLLFELRPPFDKLEEVFDEKQVTAQRDVLLSRRPKTLTSLHCPARARLEAEFDESWIEAGQVGLLLGAHASEQNEQGGYTFLLNAATPGSGPSPGAPADRLVRAKILRGDDLLREAVLRLSPGTLHLSATRHADRLTLQVNHTAPIHFLDSFPAPVDEKHVFGLVWPEAAGLRRLRASVLPLAPSASPLEQGDAFYARGELADALAEYRKQAIASGSTEFGQEARVKQAFCLVGMEQLAEAIELLEPLVAESGARWPLVASCRLWAVRLEQDELEQAYALFDGLASRFTPEEVRPLIPAHLVAEITRKYHEGSLGVNLFTHNPHEIRDLKRTLAVLEFFDRVGKSYDVTRYFLCRAYHMEGNRKEALALAAGLVADNVLFEGDRYRWFQLHEMHSWLLRLDGKPGQALAALNRQLLDGDGRYRTEHLPLLVERARVHAALEQWDRAREDLDDLAKLVPPAKLKYHHYSGAWLLRGFLHEQQGDHEAALAAWKTGLPGADARYAWGKIRTGEAFGQALILASLSKQFTASDVDALLARVVRGASVTMNPSVIKGTMRIFLADLTTQRMASIVLQVAHRPRGRETGRQVAFRGQSIGQLMRGVLAAVATELTDQMIVGPPLSPEQEQLCVTLVDEGYRAYFDGQISKGQLMQPMFTWRGLTDRLGWAGLAGTLDPSLRGPLAYILGHRFLKLGKPVEAAKLFSTAAADAPADSLLKRLAEAEQSPLPADSAETEPPSNL